MSGERIYPSLEDMKVDHLQRAQVQTAMEMNRQTAPSAPSPHGTLLPQATPYPTSPLLTTQGGNDLSHLYPELNEYMGLEFTSDVIAANMPEYLSVSPHGSANMSAVAYNSRSQSMVAPISGLNMGFQASQVTAGIRELVVCKDIDGKVGVRVTDVDKGVFVTLVKKGSPAAMTGLRFGDQILQINGRNVAGMSMDTVHSIFRKADKNGITLAVRDRPYERTITLHKDSTEHIGFTFKDGEITNIVKDSSAARNGLLINHNLLEVNAQNVVGLKDRDITAVITSGGSVITITVMPSFLYRHMTKKIDPSLLTKLMDRSMPDL